MEGEGEGGGGVMLTFELPSLSLIFGRGGGAPTVAGAIGFCSTAREGEGEGMILGGGGA